LYSFISFFDYYFLKTKVPFFSPSLNFLPPFFVLVVGFSPEGGVSHLQLNDWFTKGRCLSRQKGRLFIKDGCFTPKISQLRNNHFYCFYSLQILIIFVPSFFKVITQKNTRKQIRIHTKTQIFQKW